MTKAEAIELLVNATYSEEWQGNEKLTKAQHMAIEALQQEPKRGKWVDIDNYYRMATCSRCHKVTMFEKWGEYTKPYHYCPNCGADMRGEQDE